MGSEVRLQNLTEHQQAGNTFWRLPELRGPILEGWPVGSMTVKHAIGVSAEHLSEAQAVTTISRLLCIQELAELEFFSHPPTPTATPICKVNKRKFIKVKFSKVSFFPLSEAQEYSEQGIALLWSGVACHAVLAPRLLTRL